MNKSKPYSGIPAGILDEDLEAHMSKAKGPFGAAISFFQQRLESWIEYTEMTEKKTDYKSVMEPWVNECRSAIRVLEAAPKIRETIVEFLEWGPMTGSDMELHRDRFRALLEALPDKEEK